MNATEANSLSKSVQDLPEQFLKSIKNRIREAALLGKNTHVFIFPITDSYISHEIKTYFKYALIKDGYEVELYDVEDGDIWTSGSEHRREVVVISWKNV